MERLQSILSALNTARLIWLAVILFLGWLGFDALTPQEQLQAQSQRIDSVVATQEAQKTAIMAIQSQNADILDRLDMLNRMQCLDRSPRERAMLGLECGSIPYTGGK